MAATPKEEDIKFWLKVGGYMAGILLGLGAKLVVVNKQRRLTMRDFIYHSCIAFAAAWLVWQALDHYGQTALANLVSVIVGRFGDVILIASYNVVVDFLKALKPKDK